MNRRSANTVIMTFALTMLVAGCATVPPEPPGPTTDQRLSSATKSLHSDIQDLRNEVQNLRNQLEVKSYEVDQMNAKLNSMPGATQNRPMQPRFGQLQSSGEELPVQMDGMREQASGNSDIRQVPDSAEAPAGPAMSAGDQAVVIDRQPDPPSATQDDSSAAASPQASYDQAFNLLKQSRFGDAFNAFQSFLVSYPANPLAANAQYWSGEALYAMREFDRALVEFDKVSQNYPDSDKAPEAMLKKGYSYYELGDMASAETALNEVITRYPGARVSVSAQNRLTQIASDKRQPGAPQ